MEMQLERCTNEASSSRSYTSVVSGHGDITEDTSPVNHSNDDAHSSRTNSSINQISDMKKMHEMHRMMTQMCTDLTIASKE